MKYEYPDKNDVITCKLIDRVEPYKGYWEQSEKLLLNKIEDILSTKGKDIKILDAGCGQGRLLDMLSKAASEVYALEPDINRFNIAAERVRDRELKNVKLINSTIESLNEDEKFDVILCSHIIQHVKTEQVNEIFNAFSRMIKSDGLIFVSTCHSTECNDYYVKDYIKDNVFYEEPITKEEFNKLVDGSNVLPAHFFTLDSLNNLGIKNSLKVTESSVYHLESVLLKIIRSAAMDRLFNSLSFLKRRYGRDILICFGKN